MATVAAKPLPWWRMSAPPQFGWPLALADGLLLAPAVAGAMRAWPWAITTALMVPGFLACVALGHMAAQARGVQSQEQMPSRGVMAILGGFSGLLSSLATTVTPAHLAPLAFASVLLFVIDPLWRLAYSRTDSQGSDHDGGTLDMPGRAA